MALAKTISILSAPIGRLRLRWLLVVPFVLQICGAVGLTGWLAWRNGERAVNDLADRLSEEVAAKVEQHVIGYLNISNLFLRINEVSVKVGKLDPDDFGTLERYFWEQAQITSDMTTIYYGNQKGNFLQVEWGNPPKVSIRTQKTAPYWQVFQTRAPGERLRQTGTKKYDPRIRPWYRGAVAAGTLAWSPVYLFTDPPVLGITPALPIYNPLPPQTLPKIETLADRTKRLKGVLAIDIPLEQIGKFLRQLRIGATGEMAIIERSSGYVIATSSEEPLFVLKNGKRDRLPFVATQDRKLRAAAQFLAQKFPTFHHVGTYQATVQEGDRLFVQVLPLENPYGLDWLTVTVIPERDFMAQIYTNSRNTALMCGAALALTVLLSLVTSRWIVLPIQRLSEATEAIAQGKIEGAIAGSPISEVDRLARSFTHMTEQLRQAFDKLEQANQTLEHKVETRTAALRRSEEKFSKAFRASPDPIAITVRETGELIEVNESFVQVLGYSFDEVLGRTAEDLNMWVSLDDRNRLVAGIDRDGHFYDSEVSFYNRYNEIRIMRLSAETVTIEGRTCILWVANDMTDRIRAEAAVREKERYLRLILDSIPQHVFWKDNDLVFAGCNKNWAIAAGLNSPEEVIGKTDFDLLGDWEAAEAFREQDRRVMETGRPVWHAIALKQGSTDDGEPVWLDISKIPIQDDDGQALGILGVIEDITQRKQAEEALEAEREKSEQLLLNILPRAIANRLKENVGSGNENNNTAPIAQHFDDVSILFADIVGFTPLSRRMSPIELVRWLNLIFSQFDRLAERHRLEKIKTLGDAYMVAAGLPLPMADHEIAMASMALDMLEVVRYFEDEFRTQFDSPLQIRIGMNTGPVVAGVIGIKKFIYDLWGDTVNVASRMESQGEPSRIQVTQQVYDRLHDQFYFEHRGELDVKGRGSMTTYWLTGRR